MTKPIQHMTFSVVFKNVDAADPRCGTEIELTFGGISYDADAYENEPKERAIEHCCDAKVLAALAADYGKVHPWFRTFKLVGLSTPSDQAWG